MFADNLEHEHVPITAAFVKIEPRRRQTGGGLRLVGERNAAHKGFVLTGRDVPKEAWGNGVPPANLATSVPGVFAVGDVRAGSMKRVAAASGEGASVVPLVHAFLAPPAEGIQPRG